MLSKKNNNYEICINMFNYKNYLIFFLITKYLNTIFFFYIKYNKTYSISKFNKKRHQERLGFKIVN